jgi:CHAT domain-containing protein
MTLNIRIISFLLLGICFWHPWSGSVFGETLATPEKSREQIEDARQLSREGDYVTAVPAWETALGSIEKDRNPGLYLNAVVQLANAYQAGGFHTKALTRLKEALPLAERCKELGSKALLFSSLGDLCLSLGEPDPSLDFLGKAVKAARGANNDAVLAQVMLNVGNFYQVHNNPEEATAAYEESLELAEAPGEYPARLRVKVLINMMRVHMGLEKESEVWAVLDRAIMEMGNIAPSRDKAMDLMALNLLIRKFAQQHSVPTPQGSGNKLIRISFELLDEAKKIGLKSGDNRILSSAYGYLGQLYETQNRLKEALRLTGHATSFAAKENLADLLYLWQWQMGRLFKALGNHEEAVESYLVALETLQPIRHLFYRGIRSSRDVFDTRVKPVYLELADLYLEQAKTLGNESSRQKKLEHVMKLMDQMKTVELENYFEDECIAGIKKKESKVKRPSNVAMMYPVLLPDRLVLLWEFADGIKQIPVHVEAERVRETIRKFRKQLQTRQSNQYLKYARKLYGWLIHPAAAELKKRKIGTLVIAPDDLLRSIPFSALHDGNRFLVEKYAIATIPAITHTDLSLQEWKKAATIVCGLSQGVQGFPPLPGVLEELKNIREITGARTVLKNETYTLDNLTQSLRHENHAVIHLATHGVFGGRAEDTFLLTFDNKLTLDGLRELIQMRRFREQQMELLVLSACQTALGDERASLGLAGVAVKAGVRSVIASLWYIDDEAASYMVEEFYRQLHMEKVCKAKALQNAQKMLISKKRFHHPAYWSPFLLIGNWQ